jgi:hypothetical protein
MSGALLVGNFGDGLIHGYDINTGEMLGNNGERGRQPAHLSRALVTHTLGARGVYFTAGIVDESHGLFGAIRQSR